MLRQKTRLGKSPSKKKMVRGFPTSNTKNITAQSLNHACHFNFRSFCIDVSCGLVTCLARGAVKESPQKKVFAKKVAFVE